jgi:hypothetical protein
VAGYAYRIDSAMSGTAALFRIQLNDPRRIDELRQALIEGDYPAVRTAADTLVVAHPMAIDPAEARMELEFFLKAWQRSRPDHRVGARLVA